MEVNKTKKMRLTNEDWCILVSWMEVPENFQAIHGVGGKTSVDGKAKRTKIAAFAQMGHHLKRHTKNMELPLLTGKQMSARWKTQKNRMKAALALNNKHTGAGVSKEDFANGVSFSELLERTFPQFERMRALYEQRPNITPFATKELGALSDEEEIEDDATDVVHPDDIDDEMVSLARQTPETNNDEDDEDSGDEVRVVAAPATTPVLSVEGLRAATASGDWVNYVLEARLPGSPEPPSPKRQKHSELSEKQAVKLIHTSKGKQERLGKAKGKGKTSTKPSSTAPNHGGNQSNRDTRASLSASYATTSQAKVKYLEKKLEEEKRQWDVQQQVLAEQRKQEFDLRERELADRRAERRRQVLMELIKQNKSAAEIDAILKQVD